MVQPARGLRITHHGVAVSADWQFVLPTRMCFPPEVQADAEGQDSQEHGRWSGLVDEDGEHEAQKRLCRLS